MVQFNLLPDVKLEYMKTQRTKRMVMLAAFSAIALSVFIVVLLFLIVNVFQKQHIGNLNADIQTKTKELKDVPDLDKVLTVQNQLNSLTALHEQKPFASRLTTYLVQITPKDAKIGEVNVDFATNTMAIDGTANNLETVNRFVDILKFTEYKVESEQDKAFSEVVLKSFGVSSGSRSAAGTTSYSVEFKFNPIIFDNTKNVELIVPNIISTRSVTEAPTDLFEAKVNPDEAVN
jgi:Tfp pilus assembly protein PilN